MGSATTGAGSPAGTMTPIVSQELWWESPDGQWYWQASDGIWYPAASHPTGLPRSLRSNTAVPPASPEAPASQSAPPAFPEPPASQSAPPASPEAPASTAVPPAFPKGGFPDALRELFRRRRAFAAWLGGVVAVGLVLRLAYVVIAQPGWPLGLSAGDALYYHVQALGISDGMGFANPGLYFFSQAAKHFVVPDAEYAPLTSLILGGADWLGLSSYLTHQVIWCLIGSMTVVVISLTAREIAGDGVGIIAGAVAALYPGLWINDGMVESETLVQLSVAVLIFLSFRFWRRPDRWVAAAMGAAAGMAAMARSEGLLFIPVLVLPLTLGARVGLRGTDRWRPRVVFAALACATCMVVVAPWVVRNLMVFDHPETLATGAGETLTDGNNPVTYYGSDLGGWYTNPALPASVPLGDSSDQDAGLRRIAWHYASGHLNRVPLVLAARFARVWGLNPAADIGEDKAEGRQPWATTWGLVMLCLMIPGVVLTFAELRWLRITALPLFAPMIIVSVTAMAFFGTERYRADAEPALVLAATITSVSWADLPTVLKTLRAGLSLGRLLGIRAAASDEADGAFADGTTAAAPPAGRAVAALEQQSGPVREGGWSHVIASTLAAGGPGGHSMEILPTLPGREPSVQRRPVGLISVAVLVVAALFVAALSLVDVSGKADFVPRSGVHEALLLMSVQLNDQVLRIQYQTDENHFNANAGEGTQHVTAGSPALTYTVVTENRWICSPFADLESTVTITWPGASKPVVRTVKNLTDQFFNPVPPVSCF